MFAHVKTDYIFSSTDPSGADSEKASRAIEAVREVVRASKMLDTPNVEIVITPETEVAQAVTTYFSEPQFAEFTVHPEYEIQIGGARYRADLVLCNEDGEFAAIAECKSGKNSNYGHEPLKSFLCATNAPFGIFASGVGRNLWHFYENLHHNRFRPIEKSDFEKGILSV